MSRSILISVFVSIVFAGFESAADAAGPIIDSGHESSHEVHGSIHSDSHEHDGDDHDEDHYCHCSAHAAALLSFAIACTPENRSVSSCRYEDRFSSLVDPPLLRPPNS
jgi:hypothetical protein